MFQPIKKVYDLQQSKTFHMAVVSGHYFVQNNYPMAAMQPEFIFRYVDAHLCYILNLIA
jgi:hypothetical protein